MKYRTAFIAAAAMISAAALAPPAKAEINGWYTRCNWIASDKAPLDMVGNFANSRVVTKLGDFYFQGRWSGTEKAAAMSFENGEAAILTGTRLRIFPANGGAYDELVCSPVEGVDLRVNDKGRPKRETPDRQF